MDLVGIGDSEPREDAALEPFHALRRGGRVVFVSEEMEHPVHDEMRPVVVAGLALGAGFAVHDRRAKHDVPELFLPDGGPRRSVEGERQARSSDEGPRGNAR